MRPQLFFFSARKEGPSRGISQAERPENRARTTLHACLQGRLMTTPRRVQVPQATGVGEAARRRDAEAFVRRRAGGAINEGPHPTAFPFTDDTARHVGSAGRKHGCAYLALNAYRTTRRAHVSHIHDGCLFVLSL
ncbi:hypothetical protein MTO96_001460 [Rhipicephalus appendiculatus]